MVVSALDWVSGVAEDGESIVVFARGEWSWELRFTLGGSDVYISKMVAEATSLEQYFLDGSGDDPGPSIPSTACAYSV